MRSAHRGSSPASDGQAEGVVQVALAHEVVGVAVVGGDADAVEVPRGDGGEEVPEVLGGGALAQEDHHAAPELLAGLVGGQALVVREDAPVEVRVQVRVP